jgi:hypothetical protein
MTGIIGAALFRHPNIYVERKLLHRVFDEFMEHKISFTVNYVPSDVMSGALISLGVDLNDVEVIISKADQYEDAKSIFNYYREKMTRELTGLSTNEKAPSYLS